MIGKVWESRQGLIFFFQFSYNYFCQFSFAQPSDTINVNTKKTLNLRKEIGDAGGCSQVEVWLGSNLDLSLKVTGHLLLAPQLWNSVPEYLSIRRHYCKALCNFDFCITVLLYMQAFHSNFELG